MSEKIRKCIFPGTFEIFHAGHINILKRALKIFDFVYVVVANNPTKKRTDINARFNQTKQVIATLSLNNVEVIKWNSKISDFAEKKAIYFIIRGIRDVGDFQFEKTLGNTYKQELEKIEVVYLFSDKNLENISSRKLKSLNTKEGKK